MIIENHMREVRDVSGGFKDIYDHVTFFIPNEEKITDLILKEAVIAAEIP